MKNHENIDNAVSTTNLKFDSRKKAQNYIENLYLSEKSIFSNKVEELNTFGTETFKVAIEIIQEELRNINIQKFAKNFYENVLLFRIEVPEDTDLNHYFEIMNNRGEQLEKHEIVKALLIGKIIDKKEQEKFGIIWDICADLNKYVFLNFDKTNRENLFSEDSDLLSNNFDEISIIGNNEDNEESKLLDIIKNRNIPSDFPKEDIDNKDKYKSIIDFPNFLLQVLKIKNENVTLDDKKLLEQFNNFKPDPKEFIFDLLKYRVIFDKYIIKRNLANEDESKQNWVIRKLKIDFEKDTVQTFKKDDELVNLQVILYYSDSTNTYNNWLHEILKYQDFEIVTYTKSVLKLAKNRFNRDNLCYPEISIFNLYFIDFLLWKLYAEHIQGQDNFSDVISDKLNNLKKKISNQKEMFRDFKFKQVNSKEHLFSQSQSYLHFGKVEDFVNGIGNLCLISTFENSSGNKENPTEKKIRFKGKNSSLKRLIMFETYDENDKWEEDQIIKHKEEIDTLIEFFFEENHQPF